MVRLGQGDYRTRRALAGRAPRNYSTAGSYCLREAPRALWDPSVPADPTPSDLTDEQGENGLLCPDCVAREEREVGAEADAALDKEGRRPGKGAI
jgi:hypothetical protein